MGSTNQKNSKANLGYNTQICKTTLCKRRSSKGPIHSRCMVHILMRRENKGKQNRTSKSPGSDSYDTKSRCVSHHR